MNKFLQASLFLIAMIVLMTTISHAQQKLDPLTKAQQMMKGYKPPAPTNPPETVTPQQAWKKLFEQISTNRITQKQLPPMGRSRIVNAKGKNHTLANNLRVNIMPSYSVSSTYGNAIAGQALAVWGNVHGGLYPLQYWLDYGDGVIDSGTVTNSQFIGGPHTYATSGPKTVTLKVQDANTVVDQKSAVVQVFAVSTMQREINMAIEKGLLYNYQNQYPDGHWYDGYANTAATGGACLAFEENGHLPTNDIYTDIYAEYVQMGLEYLFGLVVNDAISVQYAGNPDSNGDGLGAYFNTGENYANGVACLAVLGAAKSSVAAQMDTIRSGPYAGKTLYDLMINLLDQIAYSQTDSVNGTYRGGWQYYINTPDYGTADNSATQWPGLVMEAAQNSWGMPILPWVKTELLYWLQYSQDGTGGFAYMSRSQWNNITKTGAGIGSYALLGYTTDSVEITNAINFLDANWSSTVDNNGYADHFGGNLYSMYAVAKGLRIINHRNPVVNVGAHNWYNEYADWLLHNPTWGQQSDGSWSNDGSLLGWAASRPLNSAFAILILTQGVIVAPPVAVIAPIDPKPPNTAFTVDGSGSFHQDPTKSIIEWLWDFNAADGIDWNHPDASGPIPTDPGYAKETTYTITLRVKDNSTPPMYSTNTMNVIIRAGHHPPVAVAIPPGRGPSYAAKVNEPILLDGRASYSPDAPGTTITGYNWDLNGDGIFGDSFSDTVTVVFSDIHQGTVGLRVYDSNGDSSSNVAYINIVASRMDLFVEDMKVTPSSIDVGGSVKLWAKFKNDPASNTDANRVLVRFYDDNPLTVGNRLGGDLFVNLPVGAEDTSSTTVTLSSLIPPGMRHFYVWLDPLDVVPEWNKANNLDSISVQVGVQNPHKDISPLCLNFGTLKLGDSLTLKIHVANSGTGNLTIDSVVFNGADYSVIYGPSMIVSPGTPIDLPIMFKPSTPGPINGTVTIYTNDGSQAISLNGQGELPGTGLAQQIFSGLASLDGMAVPAGSVVAAYRANGVLITSYIVMVAPESVKNGVNYAISILDGQAGIADGDTIYFHVISNCSEYWERYCIPQRFAIFHPAFPPPQGYTPYDIDAVHPNSLKVPVIAGYNAVSWNVFPVDNSVKSIFSNLLAEGKVKVILDYINDGTGNARFDYFIPPLGDFNPFLWTDFRKGYFVRLWDNADPDSLIFTGLPICVNVSIPLDSGYNFISYIPQIADSTGHALSGIAQGSLVNALDWSNMGGGVEFFNSYPDGPFNIMMPGKGYFANVDESQTFMYPGTSVLPTKTAHPSMKQTTALSGKPKYALNAGASPLPMAMFAYGKKVMSNGRLIPKGTDVKAVDNNGTVCGTAKFVADGIFSIAIYADNPSTPQDEGAKPGEMVKLFFNNQLIEQRVKWTEFGDVTVIDGPQQITTTTYEKAVPTSFALHQNYPNPFNPVTTIRYELPKAANVTLKIYNMLGQEVRTLEQTNHEAGYYQSIWDGHNNDGMTVSSGIYTYRLTASAGTSSFVDVRKMIFLK
ncbi:MAG: FlgD immunoglobulin-like domain containing protein [Bacteroidota bacterium]